MLKNNFSCCLLSITSIWNRAKEQYRKGNICVDVASKKRNCGRQHKNYSEKLDKIKENSLNRRDTFRNYLFAIKIPRSSVFPIFK